MEDFKESLTYIEDYYCCERSLRHKIKRFSGAVIGMVDTITDVIVLQEWLRNDHIWWFSIGLVAMLTRSFTEGIKCGMDNGAMSAFFHVIGLGLLYEFCRSITDNDYDEQHFFGTKLSEFVLEATPFFLLQTYVTIVEEDYSSSSLISVGVSYLSLVSFIALNFREISYNEDERKMFYSHFLKNSIMLTVDMAAVIVPWSFFLNAYMAVINRVYASLFYLTIEASFFYFEGPDRVWGEFYYSVFFISDLDLTCRAFYKYMCAKLLLVLAWIKDTLTDWQLSFALSVCIASMAYKFYLNNGAILWCCGFRRNRISKRGQASIVEGEIGYAAASKDDGDDDEYSSSCTFNTSDTITPPLDWESYNDANENLVEKSSIEIGTL